MPQLEFTKNEMVEKDKNRIRRYPNLSTVLMVEDFLKENRDMPVKISELKKKLPRQVMHQTLKIILEYLFISGKIIYGPKGVQWIYNPNPVLREAISKGLEL